MVTLKLPASLMCQSLPSFSRFQNVQAVTVRTHRAAFENVGREASGLGVTIHYTVKSRARFFKAEHCYRAARAATGDLCAEQSARDTLGADEFHQQIRRIAAETAFG